MAKVYHRPEIKQAEGCLVFVKPKTRVLEFGCGCGENTAYLGQVLSCKVDCVEISKESAKQATRYADKMVVADIDAGMWEYQISGLYDYILFGDVLEHLQYPAEAIRKASKYLSATGSILMSVPNIGHNAVSLALRRGKFEYRPTGLLDDSHIKFFTRSSLKHMMAQQGFRSVAQNDLSLHPCQTELRSYYWRSPVLSLSLAFRRDGHVYQFVNEWKKESGEKEICEEFFPEVIDVITALAYDFGHWLYKRFIERKEKT